MKANELMIGDWVMLYDTCWHVSNIYHDGYVILKRWSENLNQEIVYLCKVDCLSPITLTEEILKANGFELVESSFHLNIKGGLHIAIKNCRNDYKLKVVKSKTDNGERCHTNSRRWRIPEIVYVHELQNSFRICVLTELADNFKIK